MKEFLNTPRAVYFYGMSYIIMIYVYANSNIK